MLQLSRRFGRVGFTAAPAPARIGKPFVDRRRSTVAKSSGGSAAEVKIAIEGMMCDGCSSRIETVLKGMEAVKGVNVSLEGKVATVELAAGPADSAEAKAAVTVLVDAINGLGFEAKLS
ncbi:hypothetical protein TSOC_008136 [Tetrabaena socialis]|uniref:HMA domain-containing protein n=1 Tax=Tetrabaena socialis TaxID=47790 RepID=A0A2J7ZZ87_9CHLO|nr:hypothetical protein TSOC_008136 [Tetrabaena socialis]|eukprot:PNH05573.1 hypothetical protein TSOC_008136 [Tetrabaena socialis]